MEYIDVKLTGANTGFIANIPKYIKGEYVYSYLGRLANANGYTNTLEFLSMYFDKRQPFNSHILPFFLKTFELDGSSLLDGALLSNALFPFLSEKHHELLNSFYEADNGNKKIFKYAPMKLCPECHKEDMEHGLFYYRTYHQIPGVDCCTKHGCKLVEYNGEVGEEFHYPQFVTINENGNDIMTSRFFEDMVMDPVVISRNETAFAIRERLLELYHPSSYEDLIYEIHSATGIEIEYLTEYRIKDLMIAKDHSFNDIPIVASVLSHIFDDYSQFKKYAVRYRAVYQVFVETMTGSLYHLNSWNKDGSVTLKCKSCGTEFNICPSMLLSGKGCPFCGKVLNTKHLKERMASIDDSIAKMIDFPEEYKVLEIKNGYIRLLHKETGRVISDNALIMLVNPCFSDSYDVRKITYDNMDSHYTEQRKELELKLSDTSQNRIGIPVCDTLLADIGILAKQPEIPAMALFNPRYLNEHYPRIYGKQEHDVFFMKGELMHDFWLPEAYVVTLRFSSYCTNWNMDKAYELAYWMKRNGVTAELLREKAMLECDSTYSSYGATLIDEV